MNLFAVLAEYDRIVRANESPGFPTRQNVATCHDGIYGAWGEVLELIPGAILGEAGMSDEQYDALHNLFLAYQAALRLELEMAR